MGQSPKDLTSAKMSCPTMSSGFSSSSWFPKRSSLAVGGRVARLAGITNAFAAFLLFGGWWSNWNRAMGRWMVSVWAEDQFILPAKSLSASSSWAEESWGRLIRVCGFGGLVLFLAGTEAFLEVFAEAVVGGVGSEMPSMTKVFPQTSTVIVSPWRNCA